MNIKYKRYKKLKRNDQEEIIRDPSRTPNPCLKDAELKPANNHIPAARKKFDRIGAERSGGGGGGGHEEVWIN